MTGKLISLVPDLMHKRRMRAVDLQKESGLSAMTIHKVANGSPVMSTKTVEVLCGTFNAQPGEIRMFVPEDLVDKIEEGE